MNHGTTLASLDFLDKATIDEISRYDNIESKLGMNGLDGILAYNLSENRTQQIQENASSLTKSIRRAYTEIANKSMAQGSFCYKIKDFSAAADLFKNAATIYAKLDHHESYAQAAVKLALASHENLQADDYIESIMNSIDIPIANHLARSNIYRHLGNNVEIRRQLKKRRMIVQEAKAAGTFEPGQRWPRTKFKSCHANYQDAKTALNLIYLKAEAYANLGWKKYFDRERAKAEGIISKHFKQDKPYQEATREKFKILKIGIEKTREDARLEVM